MNVMQCGQRGALGSSPSALPTASSRRARPVVLARAKRFRGQDDDMKDLQRAAIIAAGVFGCLVSAHPAQAEHVWRPRRHHRRLDERYGDNWADPIVAKLEEEERLLQEAKRKAAEAAKKVQEEKLARKKAVREEKKRQKLEKQKAEQNIRKAKEALMSVVTFPRVVGEFVRDNIGFANLVIFLALVALLLKFVLGRPLLALWRALTGWRPSGPGKWVADRSLGGKMVWVPDVPTPAPAAAAASTSAPSSTPAAAAQSVLSTAAPGPSTSTLKEEDFNFLTKVAASAGASAKAATTAKTTEEAIALEMPDWWRQLLGQARGDRSRLSEAEQQEKQVAAEKVLKSLERAKVAGDDYPLASLVKLHSICQEAGCTVTPSTAGGRDAMYRAAVEGAIRAARDPVRSGRELGGWSPQQVVAGLAADLGLAEARALKIARSCVAAEMRSKLVEVVTALKKSDQTTLLVSLLQLADLQAGLPLLTAQSPEVEMIASSLNSRASLEERQAILQVAAGLAPAEVALFATLLGFDAELVVPRVIEQLRQQRLDLDGGEGAAGGAQA